LNDFLVGVHPMHYGERLSESPCFARAFYFHPQMDSNCFSKKDFSFTIWNLKDISLSTRKRRINPDITTIKNGNLLKIVSANKRNKDFDRRLNDFPVGVHPMHYGERI
jgi:hypothetical protein